MKITLTPKDGTSAVDIDSYKYQDAFAKGDADVVNNVIRIDQVEYELSTGADKFAISGIDITDASASEIIKMNSGGTAVEWAADATA